MVCYIHDLHCLVKYRQSSAVARPIYFSAYRQEGASRNMYDISYLILCTAVFVLLFPYNYQPCLQLWACGWCSNLKRGIELVIIQCMLMDL